MDSLINFIQPLYLFCALGIILYALDDVCLDISYWAIMARRLIMRKHMPPLTLEKLNARPEQRLALMVPCWQESAVVAEMLSHTLGTINYSNYEVFIGVYPNDPGTRKALLPVLKKNPHVHEVMGLMPGPTTKADNLNAIFKGILEFEQKTDTRFEVLVMHDAEDVIHPLSFKLFNYLLPAKAMAQLPVFPLETKTSWFTHWTYADEFAENHTKDMITREWIGGFAPSAGVGTAFSRPAIDKLFDQSKGVLFSAKTLTEDYAFSLFLHRNGFHEIFVHQSVKRLKNRPKYYLFGPPVLREVKEWIATRSLFPFRYGNAIRQKSRWILGISLQEWKATGWSGDKKTRYSLARDRKAPVGHILILGAYMVFAYWTFYTVSLWWTGREVVPQLQSLHPTIMITIIVLMVHRMVQRAIAVWRIYGFVPAVMTIPRSIYLNVLNVHAFFRAFWLFVRAERKQKPVVWAKTANRFPTREQLAYFRRPLGDLLVENASVSIKDLGRALEIQRKKKQRLGKILIEQGILTEDQLLVSLGKLFLMDVAVPGSVASAKAQWWMLAPEISEYLASNYAIPLEVSDEMLVLAIDDPADAKRLSAIRQRANGRDVQFVLAPEAEIRSQAEQFQVKVARS